MSATADNLSEALDVVTLGRVLATNVEPSFLDISPLNVDVSIGTLVTICREAGTAARELGESLETWMSTETAEPEVQDALQRAIESALGQRSRGSEMNR